MLDGGAMFGVVPKSIWQRTNPANEKNLIDLALRCLLIEDGNQLILIDNGLGNKQADNFFNHYYLHGNTTLHDSLKQAGFNEKDVTDVFLTHLHFDHCGGSIQRMGDKLQLTFENATYWSNKDHWKWATQPNSREKASFLPENILPIQENGNLKFIDVNSSSPFKQFEIFYCSGHTDKMMIPMIRYKERTICFVADLIPTTGHISIPFVMGYDTRPLLTMDEKRIFLDKAASDNYVLFYEHDPAHECCTVKSTDKGVRLERTFSLEEL